MFHGISATIEGMALASYMAEIAMELAPAPPEAAAQLRLLLNCLYMLSERSYPCRQLKAIYELRALTLAGYMTAVLACASCGKYDGGVFSITVRFLFCAISALLSIFSCSASCSLRRV